MSWDEPTTWDPEWDDAEEWERTQVAEDSALEAREDVTSDVCDACAGEGWLDIHDQVGDADDLPRDYELRDSRIHARCSDCNGTGAPF